jgi:hypothetical protein
MIFFQTLLVFGYAYAHWLSRLTLRKQAVIHSVLLGASLLSLPVTAHPTWKDSALSHPILSILGLLSVSVGLPYFLLSTTGPLLQAWYARTHSRGMPYRLYALSNLASMLALLTYPVLIEPYFTNSSQRLVWSLIFGLYVIACAVVAWVVPKKMDDGAG